MKIKEDLFRLIRTALWKDKQLAQEIHDVDWDSVYALAKEQCVVGIVADAFPLLTEEQCDGDEKLRWLATVIRIQQKNQLLNKLVVKLCELFRGMDLQPIVLKGQVFATTYPQPFHRQSGDIDIYFKQRSDCQKAVVWASEVDKKAAESEENKRERKHFSFHVNGCIVELHRLMCVFENERLQSRLQEIIDQELKEEPPFMVEIEGKIIEAVPPTLSVLHQILHISRHLLEAGIGLRQLCDLAMFLDKYAEQVDRQKLGGWLEELELMTAAEALGYILVRRLGLEADKLPFGTSERYAGFVLQEIFEGGNFGKKKVAYRQGTNGLLRKVRSIAYFRKRCKMYEPLFPSEAKSYFKNKITLNFRLLTKHHY